MALPMVSGEEEVVQVVGKLFGVLLRSCSGELRRGEVDLVEDLSSLLHGLVWREGEGGAPLYRGSRERGEVLLLGLACSHPIPGERPKTPAIQQVLMGALPPPVVPPFKPSFVWPAMDGGIETMSTTAGTTTSQLSLTSASTWSGNYVKGSLKLELKQSEVFDLI
nr:unnamed protein product [Digitaria exilis]